MNPPRSDWSRQSNCSKNPAPFSIDKPSKEDYIQICETCPVVALCLAHAVANDERGIWAGTTEHERKLIKKKNQIDLSVVPIEVSYQEQFLRASALADPANSPENQMIRQEESAKSELEELRRKVESRTKPSLDDLATKAVSQSLRALLNRSRGISL